jgi:hypothetical protein
MHFTILQNHYFANIEGVGRFTPNLEGLTPALRGSLPPICKKIYELFITINFRVNFLLKFQLFSVLFRYLILLGFFRK